MKTTRLAGRNLGLLLLLAALWGTAFMFIRLGFQTPSFSPILFAALRFDIAGLVVLAVALARKSPLRPKTRAQWAAILIAAVFNVTLYHALLFWGEIHTSAAVGAVIVGLNPLLTTLLSTWLLTDERVGASGIVGLLLGLGGITALALLRGGSLLDLHGLAELACLGAVLAWGIGGILVRRSKHGMDVFAFTAWQQLVGALILHASSFVFDPLIDPSGRAYVVWDGPGIAALLYLAIVSSAIGFVIYFTLLERVGPIRVNLVSNIAPIFAALAGFLYLGEPFEPRMLLAFGLILVGFLLVAKPWQKHEAPTAKVTAPAESEP